MNGSVQVRSALIVRNVRAQLCPAAQQTRAPRLHPIHCTQECDWTHNYKQRNAQDEKTLVCQRPQPSFVSRAALRC